MESTRTSSPYFSPNRASAPAALIRGGHRAPHGTPLAARRGAGREAAFGDAPRVDAQGAQLLWGIGDPAFGPGATKMAAVAGLSAGSAIKRRRVGADLPRL